MEEKSIWNRVAGLVGSRGQGTLRELRTHARRCPAGHPMALDWTDCPYCKAERNASPGTQVGQASPAAADRAIAAAQTRVRGEGELAARTLVGVVFTFSWTRVGQLFPVYAGRNYGGAAPTTRDGQRTNILLTEDPAVSGTHFMILYQQSTAQYRIIDENSANGTFVNGELIDSKGTELPDDAQIMAGKTLFIFKKLRPPSVECGSMEDSGPVASGEQDELARPR